MPQHIIGNVTPQTEFILCEGVPLDKAHINCMTFPSADVQLAYFRKKSAYTLKNCTYQRITNNTATLKLNAESVITCNYLCFCNHGYTAQGAHADEAVATWQYTNPEPPPPELTARFAHFPSDWSTASPYPNISQPATDKWWFAFIDDITYINNGTCTITYTIDVMQSYMFDILLNVGMVERMHIDGANDTFYVNRVDEDLETGQYFVNYQQQISLANPSGTFNDVPRNDIYPAIVTMTVDEDKDAGYKMFNNLPSWLDTEIYQYPYDGFADVLTKLRKANKLQNIVAAYAIPSFLYNRANDNTVFTPTLDVERLAALDEFTEWVNGEVRETYTPINHKLEQYPYNRLVISNNRGQEKILRFELFPSLKEGALPLFRTVYSVIPLPSIALIPYMYNTLPTDYIPSPYSAITINNYNQMSMQNAVTIDDFPMIPLDGDAFRSWLSQSIAPSLISAGSAAATAYGGAYIAGAGTAAATGAAAVNPVAAAVIAGGMALLKAVGEGIKATKQPDPVYGTNFKSELLWNIGLNGFSIRRESISATRAEYIDRYFSMFGYQWYTPLDPLGYRQDIANGQGWFLNSLWNYIKTIGASFKPSVKINADHGRQILSIFDSGTTFWHIKADLDDSHFGVYTSAAMRQNHDVQLS